MLIRLLVAHRLGPQGRLCASSLLRLHTWRQHHQILMTGRSYIQSSKSLSESSMLFCSLYLFRSQDRLLHCHYGFTDNIIREVCFRYAIIDWYLSGLRLLVLMSLSMVRVACHSVAICSGHFDVSSHTCHSKCFRNLLISLCRLLAYIFERHLMFKVVVAEYLMVLAACDCFWLLIIHH
jgi:hypothetical protein